MNLEKLSLKKDEHYAVSNLLQSIENARIYCSYLENSELRYELEEAIERFKKKVEKKIANSY